MSHLIGGVAILKVLRSQLRLAEVSPGDETLDIHALHERNAVYILFLAISSANLSVLSVLPWRERVFEGLPSEKLLRFTYISTLTSDVPQFVLQIIFITTEREHVSDLTISIISLVCSACALVLRLLRRSLQASTGRIIKQRSQNNENQDRLQPMLEPAVN